MREVIASTQPDRQWSEAEIEKLVQSKNAAGYWNKEFVNDFPGRSAVAIRSKLQSLREIQQSSEQLVKAHKTVESFHCFWTDSELEKLVSGVKKFDKDYGAISELIGTKSREQVGCKVRHIVKKKSKCSIEGFAKVELQRHVGWTDKEKNAFWGVIEKYGMNCQKLKEACPNRSWKAIMENVK